MPDLLTILQTVIVAVRHAWIGAKLEFLGICQAIAVSSAWIGGHVDAGQTFVDPGVAGKLLTHVAGVNVVHDSTVAESLSPRELDVLRLLANGRSNTDIAAQLFLSEGTVRNYVSGIFTKLGVTDRTQAAIIALRHGLVN